MKNSLKIFYREVIIALIITELILFIWGNGWIYCLFKIVTSGSCLMIAYKLCKVYPGIKMCQMLLGVLIFCFSGDVCLGINSASSRIVFFYFGMASFEAALILYWITFYRFKQVRFSDFLIPFVGLLIVLGLTVCTKLIDLGNMLLLCAIYAWSILAMFWKSVSLHAARKTEWTKFFLIGSILFTLSDLELLLTLFHVPPLEYSEAGNHVLYFPALLFLTKGMHEYCASKYILANENRENAEF